MAAYLFSCCPVWTLNLKGDLKQMLVKVSDYGLSPLFQRGPGRTSAAEMATNCSKGEACAMRWKALGSIKPRVYSK